jgi:hypothetical protein
MYLDEKTVIKLNMDADNLALQFDAIITQYAHSLGDSEDGCTPFVILAAVASVLTKIAMATDNDRAFVFDSLQEMVPDDITLKAMSEHGAMIGNVVPISKYKH